MKHALITGGAGFIGSHLARRLTNDGVSVTLVDNFQRGKRDADLEALIANPLVSLVACDLLDEAAVSALPKTCDTVFHLAAIVGVQNVVDSPLAVLTRNIRLQENLLRWAADLPALERFLFTSTSEVYAGTLETIGLEFPTPESTVLAMPDLKRPRTSYMLSKIYGEAMCWNSSLPCTVVRPHNIYGPRMGVQHVVPELLLRIHNLPEGGQLDVFSADHQRTFCFIEDAVEAFTLLASSPNSKGGTFNVGNETPEVTIGELAELLIRVSEKNIVLAAGPVTVGSPSRRCPSMAAAREAVGFESRVSLEEGVRRTLAWYRQHVFSA